MCNNEELRSYVRPRSEIKQSCPKSPLHLFCRAYQRLDHTGRSDMTLSPSRQPPRLTEDSPPTDISSSRTPWFIIILSLFSVCKKPTLVSGSLIRLPSALYSTSVGPPSRVCPRPKHRVIHCSVHQTKQHYLRVSVNPVAKSHVAITGR